MKWKEILLLIEAVPLGRFKGIAQFAREAGWHLTIEDRSGYAPPVGWKGDGAIVMLKDDDVHVDYIQHLRRSGTVVVSLTENCPQLRLPRVLGDGLAVGRLAAEHFSERGFRHVAWFSAEWSTGHKRRLAGFVEAWPWSQVDNWTFPQNAPVGGKSLMEWLERRLLKASRPLAVFCYNDYDAADVLNACIRLDIPVPKDVAVLGVDDNSILCETQPFTISSVRYDHESVGYESARLLDRLINSDTAARRSATLSPPILIPPLGITVRTSTDTVAASHPLVSAAMSYIQQNLARQFGAQEIAAHLNVPRIRLDRAFAADIGRSVGSEIRRQRIDRVCKLLANTDISISQIAAKTGFCNASFMIKSFRQATGITPRAWREMEFARQTRL